MKTYCTHHSFKLLAAVVLSLGLLTACGGDTEGGKGETSSSNGVATSNGTTGGSCSSSDDCAGQLCIDASCQPCSDDAACSADPAFGAGATCDAGRCGSSCTPGQMGCECAMGTACAQGICQDNVCVDCTLGSDNCPCYGNETCDAGLMCNTDAGNVCEICPEGDEGCACNADSTCSNDLICMDSLCVVEDCQNTPGRESCPCDTDNTCTDGLICTDGGMCAVCSNDLVGCACDADGACTNNLVCDSDQETCRDPLTCEDAECAPNQQCDEGEANADATCLEACLPGFTWNAATTMCDLIVDANCTPGVAGSILDSCSASNRACILTGDGAQCGACLTGFIDDNGTLDTCRAPQSCADVNCATQNRACTENTNSTDATCGTCLEGFNDEAGTCVAITQNCIENDEGSILAECSNDNRICVENGNTATCGSCIAGFAEDTAMGNACRPSTMCADLDCGASGRECAGDPFAECGGCLGNAIPIDPNDPNSACRDIITCGQLDQGSSTAIACDTDNPCLVGGCFGADGCEVGTDGCDAGTCGCGEGSFCSDLDDRDAVCSSWPCTDANGNPDLTQAFDENTRSCVDCGSLTCREEGETGNLWPFTTQPNEGRGRCVCETESGFYADLSGDAVARACDADDDGWVRESARAAIESSDPALSVNARCSLRSIDRFVLQNEYQQQREILLCVAGTVPAIACSDDSACGPGRCLGNAGQCADGEEGCFCGCIESSPIPLYEPVRNDDQTQLNIAASTTVDVPSYSNGGNGRALTTPELNSLTRACVTASGDFNKNGLPDVSEAHLMDAGDIPETAIAETNIFVQFSYMTELHEGWFARDPGLTHGRYVIAERSRCDTSFPIRYNEELDGDYWRSCTRNRDSNYNSLSGSTTGFDFAKWSCDAAAETCELAPPIAEESLDGEIPPHGLCDGLTMPPVDGIWRGMNHHSQFKCAVINNTAPTNRDENPQILTPDELTNGDGTASDARHQFNECYASDSEMMGGDATNAVSPSIVCNPIDRARVSDSDVGFVAMRQNESGYINGCIDEWAPSSDSNEATLWKNLCPGFDANSPGNTQGIGDIKNFGKLLCGCNSQFGGSECDQGCSREHVSFGGNTPEEACKVDTNNGYCTLPAANEANASRLGFWMCGDFSTTAYTDTTVAPFSTGGGYALEGEVPNVGFTQDGPMCEGDDCNSGWSIQ